MRLAFALAALAAAVAAPASAQTAAERAQLAAVHARGTALFLIDRAAWIATDDFRTKPNARADQTLRGYIVERAPQGFTVTFFGEEKSRLVGAYVAKLVGDKIVSSQVIPRGHRAPLTAQQVRLAKAQMIRDRPGFSSCGGPLNVAAIPPASASAPMDVYYLSPRISLDACPFGSHYRVTLAPDGRMLARRKFANSCLSLPKPPPNAFGVGLSHLLDPLPTEIHVFNALAIGRPVLVITGERTWQVDGRSISLIDPRKIKGEIKP